jgi:hypothetical protein
VSDPAMRKLMDIRNTGYVGQEFIPTHNAQEGVKASGTALRYIIT